MTAPSPDATETSPLLAGHRAWEAPGFLLWHATLQWQRTVAAALRPLELTHVQFVMLGSVWWLHSTGTAPSQRELADHAGTDVMMTSQVVRALERRGLLVRDGDPADARVKRLRITAEGERLAERAVAALDRADAAFFARAGDRDAVVGMLQRLADRDGEGQRLGQA